MRGFLSKIGNALSKVEDCPKADTLKDALTRLNDIKTEFADEMAKAATEHPGIPKGLAGKDTFEAGTVAHEAARTGDMLNGNAALTGSRVLSYEKTTTLYEQAIDALKDVIRDPAFVAEHSVIKDALRNTKAASRQQYITFRDTILKYNSSATDARSVDEIAKLWANAGFMGAPDMTNLDKARRSFKNELWNKWFYDSTAEHFIGVREVYAKECQNLIAAAQKLNPDIDTRIADEAHKALVEARNFDNAIIVDDRIYSSGTDAVIQLANKYEIATATEAGKKSQHLVNAINKYLPEGTEKYKRLEDIDLETAQKALAEWAVEKGKKPISVLSESMSKVSPSELLVPAHDGNMFSYPQVLHQSKDGINQMFQQLETSLKKNWGKVVNVDERTEKTLGKLSGKLQEQMLESRLKASAVAAAERDFALLNYEQKTGLDKLLSYIYPYQFWYNRTYRNWIARIAEDPKILAGYAKYRSTLEEIHAGMPDWWKYNINTNELLGIDAENPLFFNLEATMNPLNGLTGVDFSDANKRVTWYSTLLDDIGKFGPTTWTPFSWATALMLYKQGEEEAAIRWAGRLIPGTATLKSAASLANIKLPMGGDIDPFVAMFSKGLDPYERRRVGRALGQMVEDGLIDQATALDVAQQQEGEIWDEAVMRSTKARAGGQLASFFMGVGFKARNKSDIAIDQFYTDYFTLIRQRPNMSSEEYKESLDELHADYPFMDTVLLSRNTGVDRDNAYAYNIIGRIPPGQKNEIAELVGIKGDLLDKFYNDKGIDKWKTTDQQRFMAGIVDIAAVLDVPDTATKAEWTEASNRYSQMIKQAESIFGKDIQDKVNYYYSQKGTTSQENDKASQYLDDNPVVSDFMDWKSMQVINDPLLSAYYGGFDTIEQYYKGVMYRDIESKLGKDIWDKWNEYWFMQENGGEYKAYYRQHPELAQYSKMRKQWYEVIDKKIINAASYLQEGKPAAIRPQAELGTLSRENLAYRQPQEPAIPWEQWQYVLPDNLQWKLANNAPLDTKEMEDLAELAVTLGMQPSQMLTMIQSSLTQ